MGFAVPAQDAEYSLAYELLSKDGLPKAILETLVGQPQRYSQLLPLIGDRNDEVLTKTLKSMRSKGLLKPGVDLAARQKVYALSALGKLVVFRMHEMVPHQASIEAYTRGQAAARAMA
ncbi:MAG: hypothetical protein QOI63_1844 [Thermoplasmata archaeon]|jgi:DNA-binding HxlR family transcriptional regulator|nr:hypothetical protein [Thermoplasmata archaeon]